MSETSANGARGREIAVDRLAVHFGDVAGLSDLSLTVAAGERVVVVGPSGAGKTTLLRAIAGLAAVQAGAVRVGGDDVTSRQPERRGVVYLHQTPVLFPHLDVGQNVAFPLRVRGAGHAVAASRVREALDALHLSGFERRSAMSLSGGQRHRVALARAIAARPAGLLLDEPLSALDPALRADVRDAIVRAQKDYGPAMLLVTHDLDDAGLLADRIAVLLGGRLAQVATPATLFARPASLAVARFLGVFEEVTGVVGDDGRVTCPLGVLPADARGAPRHAGQHVAVVMRADALRAGPPVSGSPQGRVVAVRQRARVATVVVRVDDGGDGIAVEATCDMSQPVLAVGDVVSVMLDMSRALVFPIE